MGHVAPSLNVREKVEQYPCFDGLRATAALMVIVYHAVFFAAWFRTPGGTLFWNLNSGLNSIKSASIFTQNTPCSGICFNILRPG